MLKFLTNFTYNPKNMTMKCSIFSSLPIIKKYQNKPATKTRDRIASVEVKDLQILISANAV
jgi:hypothetical protein